MDAILQYGIAFIQWIQPAVWLTLPMKFFSFLGSEEFFLLGLPILYWCIDASLGLRVGVILMLTGGVNDAFKLLFHGPRPYWFTTDVRGMAAETSFGVPSGHAQMAAGVWGMLASYLKRPWAWGTAIFIIFSIGFSRLYLGVHFPHDVLLGWLLGAFILWSVLRLWNRVASWISPQSLPRQIGWAFALSMALLLLSVLAFSTLQGWQVPAEWISNAEAAGVDELPNPVTLSGALTQAGVIFGLFAGLAWLNSRGGFSAAGSLDQRTLRYLVGLVGVAIFWFGLGAIFPRGEELLPYVLRYVRYALVGLWVSAGAPYLFMRFGLAAKKSS